MGGLGLLEGRVSACPSPSAPLHPQTTRRSEGTGRCSQVTLPNFSWAGVVQMVEIPLYLCEASPSPGTRERVWGYPHSRGK